MGRRLIGWLLVVALLLSGGMFFRPFASEAKLADSAWPMWRHDLQHTGRSPYSGPATPNLAWTFATGYYIRSEPAIGADGTIYIGSNDYELYALNPDGSKKWEFAALAPIAFSPATGADGTIYVGSLSHMLYAINPDGSKKWERAVASASSAAIGANGTIYLGSYDTNFYAINPDGSERWKFPAWTRNSCPAIGTDATIYFASHDGKLYAINPDGSKKWEFAALVSVSPSIGGDGTIYVGASSEDKLYAINSDGSKKWEFATPMGIRSSVAIGANGTIYVGSMSFKLYAVQGTPITSPSPTPTPSASPSTSSSPTSSPSPSPSPSPTTPPGSFTDVPPGYWAHDEIMSLVTAGVINGYQDGTFKPENPVTRAEFAKMALLSLGYTLEFPASPSFPDLDPTAWYFGYVEGAVKNGLVQGYPDGTFQPQGNITMAEILTVIMRAKGRTPVDPIVPTPIILLRDRDDSLRPITAGDWFFQIVGSAENWGLLRFPEKVQIAQPGSGPDEYEFRFNSPASRAQTAVFLWR